MTDRPNRKYVDHPAPSIGLMAIMLVSVVAVIAVLPVIIEIPAADVPPFFLPLIWTVSVPSLAILLFYFWPLYTTYYTLSPSGIQVRYGPWTREYPWSDFAGVYWQKGMFTTRIGLPSVSPCVRLSDAVVLKRKAKRSGLRLTPNDPRAFIQRIAELAPDLTREVIM